MALIDLPVHVLPETHDHALTLLQTELAERATARTSVGRLPLCQRSPSSTVRSRGG